MAGPRTCRSPCGNPCQKPLPIGKDELAEGAQEAPTDNSGTPVPTSRTLILASTPVLTPSSAPASTNELFKKFMKACLENQTQAPAPSQAEPREQPLKAWFPDFYYKNLYIDCYHFCHQCQNYFETAGATRPNRISFATSFLRGMVIQQW